MKIRITNLHTDREWVLEGSSADVEAQIARHFPWVYAANPRWNGPAAMLRYLAKQQAYIVKVVAPASPSGGRE